MNVRHLTWIAAVVLTGLGSAAAAAAAPAEPAASAATAQTWRSGAECTFAAVAAAGLDGAPLVLASLQSPPDQESERLSTPAAQDPRAGERPPDDPCAGGVCNIVCSCSELLCGCQGQSSCDTLRAFEEAGGCDDFRCAEGREAACLCDLPERDPSGELRDLKRKVDGERETSP